MANLDYESVVTGFGNLAAAGTSEVKSAVVDMQGFDELEYQVVFGDNTSGSVITIAAKENTASSTTSPTPTSITLTLARSASGLGTAAVVTNGSLVVTAAASDTDSKVVIVTVKKSAMSKRYQFLSVTPATQNAVIASITYKARAAKNVPVTQSSDVIAIAYAAS